MSYRSMPRFRVALALVLLALAVAPPAGLQAQIGGSIGYGSSVFGTIAAAGGQLTYSFTGSAGDQVQAHARHWTGTLDPRIALVGPDGQTLASSTTDPFGDDPLAASLALILPQAGIYSLQIGGDQDTTGDFVLTLRGRGPIELQMLLPGQSVDVAIPQNPSPQWFGFEAQDCPTVLTVANLSSGQPFTFPYYVSVRDALGTEIAQLMGGDALEDRLTVAPASGRYEVQVSSLDPAAQGTIRLLVSCADQVPGCIPGSMASGAAAGGSTPASAGACPSCFSEEFEDDALCETFQIELAQEGPAAIFNWPPVAGAEWYIFSIVDAAQVLVADSAVMLDGVTSHTYVFQPADAGRGPFTAHVTAGSETLGHLCADDVPVEVNFPPGPGQEDVCEALKVGAEPVPGEPRKAVLFWEAIPQAGAYLIHIYAIDDDDSLIGIRVFPETTGHTTLHLTDMFPADYDRYRLKVGAYLSATGGGAFGDMPLGFLCSGEADIRFDPMGPVLWGDAP